MVNCEDLRTALLARFEWIAVRENGRTLHLRADEIEITGKNGRTRFGFVGDKGFRSNTVRSFLAEGDRIFIELSAEFGRDGERLELVARESAASLAADIEFARLQKANEIAESIGDSIPGCRVSRVSLNADNGRLAHIEFSGPSGGFAALADVTATQTAETLLTTALKWRQKLQTRQKAPINSVSIAGERRQARALQKLCALLNSESRKNLGIIELPGDSKPARQISIPAISKLWRERAPKLKLPAELDPSDTAREIIAQAPGKIDIIYSANGETLRFYGLPFARVRRAMGSEAAWFGVGPQRRRALDPRSLDPLADLIEELEKHRCSFPPVFRHEYYRLSPEAWLESILRRNIKLLDANLILSPIYNQFRSSNDKIDLLALRKDGRLVIIELKTFPDRETIYQAADYWRKIELQRRRGELNRARLFGDLPILDKPALVYVVAPALSFHADFEFFAKTLMPEIELWRWELHENWRNAVKVIARKNYLQR